LSATSGPYLERSLRDTYGFIGTPLRVGVRVREDRRRAR
jgi:predicted GTPase